MAQTFYITWGDSPLGPVNPRELREMARAGRISADTQISLDGQNWFPASNLNGLEFASAASPAAPAIGDRQSSPLDSLPPHPALSEINRPSSSAPRSLLSRFLNEDQDPDAVAKVVEKIQQILMSGEEILYVAVQQKPVVNLAPDCIVLTSKRFIFYKVKLLGQTSFEDRIWRELYDARIEEGMMGATFSIQAGGGAKFTLDYLPKAQARQLYRVAQEMEEKCAEERRQRHLEEKRAGATGVFMGAGIPTPDAPTTAVPDETVAKLTKLKQLADAGLITAEEYAAKKAELLARM